MSKIILDENIIKTFFEKTVDFNTLSSDTIFPFSIVFRRKHYYYLNNLKLEDELKAISPRDVSFATMIVQGVKSPDDILAKCKELEEYVINNYKDFVDKRLLFFYMYQPLNKFQQDQCKYFDNLPRNTIFPLKDPRAQAMSTSTWINVTDPLEFHNQNNWTNLDVDIRETITPGDLKAFKDELKNFFGPETLFVTTNNGFHIVTPRETIATQVPEATIFYIGQKHGVEVAEVMDQPCKWFIAASGCPLPGTIAFKKEMIGLE